MTTIKTLDDHSADDLRDALGRMNASTITQVLPTSEIRPNEGLHTRDYLVIYEEAAPTDDALPHTYHIAGLPDEAPVDPSATVKQEVTVYDARSEKYKGFEAWVDVGPSVRVGGGATREAAIADYLTNVTAAIESLQEVQAALKLGNYTQAPPPFVNPGPTM